MSRGILVDVTWQHLEAARAQNGAETPMEAALTSGGEWM